MNDLQRTAEWYLLRKGKITASEIEQVMHKGKKDVFSVGCISYLKGAVADYYKTDEAFVDEKMNERTNMACRWGIDHEDEARNRYMEETGNIVVDAPFIPMADYELNAGGSPDGIVASDMGTFNATGIIEIKCPFNTAIHFEHYLYECQEDLKADNPQYYAQIQMNMIISGDYTGKVIEWCDFISYDPRVEHDKQIKVLRVFPDEEYQNELMERIALAVDWMDAYKKKIEEA